MARKLLVIKNKNEGGKMKINRLAISEEGFIFDPETGNSFTTNSTGLTILKYLKEGMSIEKIASKIAQEYEIEEEEALKDILDFIEQLRIYGIFQE